MGFIKRCLHTQCTHIRPATPLLAVMLCAFFSCETRTSKSTLFGSIETQDTVYDLPQIQQTGTLIAVTLKGPNTYYIHRGQELGPHFLLAKEFARHIGAKLQIEIASDTASLFQALEQGEADFIALEIPPLKGWTTRQNAPLLQQAINEWWNPQRLIDAVQQQTAPQPVHRTVRPLMHNRSKGVISNYDPLLIAAARELRWDWRLLAAQCYQESGFDPYAESWTGALGLMQVMPATAMEMGFKPQFLTHPSTNIQAATRYLKRLQRTFADIPHPTERIAFILAAYNGGALHIRDAMALALKHGENPHKWSNVRNYVLSLSDPKFYNDPVVKNGYMRGSETESYVRLIMARWQAYKQYARPHSRGSIPKPARRHLENGKHKSSVQHPDSATFKP